MEIELQGSDVLAAQLLALPEKVRNAVEKKAVIQVNQAAAEILRKNVPADTGTLRQSVGSVVRSYKNGRIVVGITGPRNEYSYKSEQYRDYATKKGHLHIVEYIDKKTGKLRTKRMHYTLKTKTVRHLQKKNPAVNYAHLVEGGTADRFHQSGKSTGRVAPNPFTERSVRELESQASEIFGETVKRVIESL
jgi:hypothetical protein